MSRCSKCGGSLVSSSETCISCGKSNPLFQPREFRYTNPIVTPSPVGRPRIHPRPIDPGVRMVTMPSWKR